MPTIELQRETDAEQIAAVNKCAFSTSFEANLVQALIASDVDTLSLVAKTNHEVVGHLLLSEMTLSNSDNASDFKLYGLAPMSVVSDQQKQGIGTLLIGKAIEVAKEKNIDVIFVLGHPEYYPKFNFQSTASLEITCQYDVPPEVFMALDLSGRLSALSGQKVLYSDIFQNILND